MLTVNTNIGKFDFDMLMNMHRHIFGEIYNWAGTERIVPIEKAEKVLNGLSVQYASPKEIKKAAINIIKSLHKIPFEKMSIEMQTKELARHTASLWQVHPFREGNTRTVAAFAESRGMIMDQKLLKQHSQYVRNALVMSSIGPYSEPQHLEKIFKDSLEKGRTIILVQQRQERINEIKYSPPIEKLKALSTKKEFYDFFAQKFFKSPEITNNFDELIIKEMIKDGKDKPFIQASIEFSPAFVGLSKAEKVIQSRSLVNSIAKQPEMKKLLSLNNDLSR